jgi:hypothetical protein
LDNSRIIANFADVDKKRKIAQIEGWLKLIERVRLFCNSADELGRLVGFSVTSRNSLSRKGGSSLFMKEAIFHQLCHICQEQTGLDLQRIVEAYEDVDNFIDRYANLLRDDHILPRIVDIYYGSGNVPDDLSFVKKRLEDEHIPILLLMLTGSLPRLSAKNGDVQSINADYRRTFSLLRGVCKNVIMQELPAISMMESEVKACHPVKRNRLYLIYTTNVILHAYGAISTQQRLSLTNREMLWKRVCPPDIEGIWTEDDSFTAFWYFEEISNGYYLYHYKLRSEQQELAYTRYFISFYENDDDSIEAVLVHPRSIRYIINGQPVPNMLFAYQNCQMSHEEIVFSPKDGGNDWFRLRHLIRSSHAKYYQMLLDDDTRKKTNECSDVDYDFDCCLAALTSSHIYMDCSDGGYYKIPKSLNDVLYDVQFGDNVGIISFEGSTYVAFDDKSLYYDVTTEDKMREFGIEVVETIT